MSTKATAAANPAAKPVAGYSGTLIAACAAAFAAQAISALPASLNGLFQADLGTTGHQLTWITAAFMIAVVVFEFTFGVLGDMYGRKKLVLGGVLLAVIGCIVCATAPNVQILWVGAAINGLGAGAMFPGSLSLVAAITHTPEHRARAVAMWAGAFSLACFIGPLAGGIISADGNWRTSYWFLLLVTLVAGVLTLLLAVESSAPEGRKLDLSGQITFALGLILVLYAIIQGPATGWGHWSIIGAFVLGAVLLAAFVAIERRALSPILNLSLFRNRAFTVTSIVSTVGMFAFLGIGYSISIWMGPLQHQSPLRIALVFLLLQAPAFVFVPVISKLLRTVNPTWLLASGWLLLGVGALLFMRLDVADNDLAPFVLPTLVAGFGFALSVSSMTAVAVNSVPLHLVGMASATSNMIRDLGFALGPAIIGTVALSHAAQAFSATLRSAGLPPQDLAAATEIGQIAGPIAVNSLPPGAPGSAAHGLALDALGNGFILGYLVLGIAALAAAAITVVGMIGVDATEPAPESLYDPLHPDMDSEPVIELHVPVHPHQNPAPR